MLQKNNEQSVYFHFFNTVVKTTDDEILNKPCEIAAKIIQDSRLEFK